MILLSAETEWKCPPLAFAAGKYLVEASTAATALHCQDGIKVASIKNPKPWDASKDWNGKNILLCRSGGFGDLMFLTPLLRAMRAKWPTASLSFATTTYYREALQDNPLLDAIIPYPHKTETAEKYDAILWFEGLIEWSEKAKTTNSIDLHADFAGVELTQDKTMDYYAHSRHLESMNIRFPKPKGPRIGVQLSASARARTYPPKLIGELIGQLADWIAPLEGQIILFDAPRKEKPEDIDPIILSLPTEDPPLSFGQSAAILSTCDGMIAPDSALCHVAGALNIPTVALYGPFPWQLRTQYAPSIHGINGHARCAPCFWHDRESVWPKDGPCATSGKCEALASIEPDRIIKELKRIVEIP